MESRGCWARARAGFLSFFYFFSSFFLPAVKTPRRWKKNMHQTPSDGSINPGSVHAPRAQLLRFCVIVSRFQFSPRRTRTTATWARPLQATPTRRPFVRDADTRAPPLAATHPLWAWPRRRACNWMLPRSRVSPCYTTGRTKQNISQARERERESCNAGAARARVVSFIQTVWTS